MTALPDFAPAIPEIVLAIASLALLLVGAFKGDGSTRLVSWLGTAALAVVLVLVWANTGDKALTFGGMFIADRFASFAKCLILIASGITLVISQDYLKLERMDRPEYAVLVLLATLGMLMLVSANDLMSLYLGLELMSLSLYVVAAFRRDAVKSSEAGLKYFVLGALGSGLYLYGASLVYGFTGTTSFTQIATTVGNGPSIGLIAGLVFVMASLAFKISAVPFHMWTPDVYEGAPTSVTAFFAVAPKIAALCLMVRVLIGPFGPLVDQWQQVVVFISLASMILGSFAAVVQKNIKRLLAYSSIGHVGFALVGLASGTEEGVRGVLAYLAIYLFMNLGTFACVLAMKAGGRMVEDIKDLSGLSRTNPLMALCLAAFMFSMAGVPPLAGFFGKLYVFMAAVHAGLYALSIIGVLASVVAAYYYLRVVKIMYFDEPAEAFDRGQSGVIRFVMAASAVIIAIVIPLALQPMTHAAQAAAATLFLG
jgi:NADH-quinone oxidoreductase subunit N